MNVDKHDQELLKVAETMTSSQWLDVEGLAKSAHDSSVADLLHKRSHWLYHMEESSIGNV